MRHDLPLIQYSHRAGILDLGWGHPHPAALPVQPWSAAVEVALRTSGWQALTYGAPAGPGPLLEWLAEHLSRTDRVGVDAKLTFVTAGASHALDLVSTILTRPGDLVLVDTPTYHLALRVLADRGVEIARVPVDRDGIDPAATAGLIATARRAGRRVPLLYLVPTFGNPTGDSLPDRRREELVEMARGTGVTIVEDDTYRELVYHGTAPASLWSLSGSAEPVIRIGSFAKTVAPGLRLGWINASRELIGALSRRGYVDSGGGVNHTNALAMATFGATGEYQRHVSEVRARYAAQRDSLVGALRTALPDLAVPSPDGGWFVWLRLPTGVSASALRPVAERLGMSFMEGSRFYAGGDSRAGGDGRAGGDSGAGGNDAPGDDHIRLSFSLLDPLDLAEAARRLATAIDTGGLTDRSTAINAAD